MRLIDGYRLYDYILDVLTGFGQTVVSVNDVLKAIDESDTIDAVPVVHGKWIFDAENYEWNCSECQDWPIDGSSDEDRTNYCPNCGAKMDGEE